MGLTKETLATEKTFSDLAKFFYETRKLYERFKMAQEAREVCMEQKKKVLRAAGILDDY